MDEKRSSEQRPLSDARSRLGAYIREILNSNAITNNYSAIAPRRTTDGTVTIRVKDKRQAKMLTITITESAE